MKKTALIFAALAAVMSCNKYEYTTEFSAPTELSSPESIALDLTSSENIVLSWSGGGAKDGGIVLYNVIFDEADGDFSDPLSTVQSDNGGLTTLTMTQAALNNIARSSGIKPLGTGKIKWTVTASRGGEVKQSEASATINVTRPDGIDNIPQTLYLHGTAIEDSGVRAFRTMSEGIFRIYTTLKDGDISFKSSADNAEGTLNFFYDEEVGKLREDNGQTSVSATAADELCRITVDFNARTMTIDRVGKEVHCIWGASFGDIAVLTYQGNGIFVGEGDIKFLQPGDLDWLTWVEERYYFKVTLNGGDMIWGRQDDVSAERPVGGEPPYFYSLKEMAWDQWTGLWKMKGDLDQTHATITIYTNSDNLMIHSFSNVTPL